MRTTIHSICLILLMALAGACSTPQQTEKTAGPDTSTWQYAYEDAKRLLQQGEYGKALDAANLALKRVRAVHGETHPDVGIALASVGIVYTHLHNHRFAESHYGMALRVFRDSGQGSSLLASQTLLDLGNAHYHQQKYADAQLKIEQALASIVKILGWEDPAIVPYLESLARAYEIRSRFGQAVSLRERAVRLIAQQSGAGHLMTAKARARLAHAMTRAGNAAPAVALFKQSIPVLERTQGNNNPDLAIVLDQFADAYVHQKQYSAARPVLSRALSIRRQVYGDRHVEVADSYERIANLYKEMGDAVRAYENREKSRTIRSDIDDRI